MVMGKPGYKRLIMSVLCTEHFRVLKFLRLADFGTVLLVFYIHNFKILFVDLHTKIIGIFIFMLPNRSVEKKWEHTNFPFKTIANK